MSISFTRVGKFSVIFVCLFVCLFLFSVFFPWPFLSFLDPYNVNLLFLMLSLKFLKMSSLYKIIFHLIALSE